MEQSLTRQSLTRFATGALHAAHRVRTWASTRTTRATRAHPTWYFLFVGDTGSCLGGMQDYYGAYDSLDAAIAAAPGEVHWAEVAAIADGRLEVVATGEHLTATWRWCALEEPAGETASFRE